MSQPSNSTAKRIQDKRILLGMRVAWVLIVISGLLLFAAGTVRYYESVLISPRYLPFMPVLREHGLDMNFLAAWLVGFDIVGAIIATALALLIFVRRSHDFIAYTISLMIFFVGFSFSFAIAQLDPVFGALVITVGFFFLIMPINLFPNGRYVPAWTRYINLLSVPFFIVTMPLQVAALNVSEGTEVPSTYGLAVLGMLILFALTLMGQILRYRRHSSAVQRQQTKFVLYGLSLAMFFEICSWLTAALPGTAHPFGAPDRSVYTQLSLNMMLMAKVFDVLAVITIPLGFGFAILRARLWDIDLVINRSLVYGAASTLVAASFAGLALLISAVLGPERSDLSLILAVILSLLLFNPARHQVQRFVDRRIYGLRFDLDQLADADRIVKIERRGGMSGQMVGAYRLNDLIGTGGMGEVYKGEMGGQQFAVKVLPYSEDTPQEMRERFAREAELTQRLQHPHIVSVHTFGEQERCFYMVMELLNGIDLYRQIKQQGAMTYETMLPIVERIVSALDYIHTVGLVHRDLKPSNIMVNNEAAWLVKLMDFGIAKTAGVTSITGTGAIGTIDYMAPEQIKEARTVDHRADIYALAVMIYEMLSGARPFTGSPANVMFAHLQQPPPSLKQIMPAVNDSISEALQRAMAKEAEDRFASAGAFLAAMIGQPTSVAS